MKAVAFFAGLAVVEAAKVTPIQKVIQMLESMAAKGKQEKHNEQVQFAAYKQFCDDTSKEKQQAITKANQEIEKLTADIQKAASEAARLAKEVQEHEADIATFEGDKAASTKVRKVEAADYAVLHKDYSESIDALERATAVLKSKDRNTAGAALAQVDALIPAESKKMVTAFLSTTMEVEQPTANAYEFQSGGVIDMLEKLSDKFVDERTDIEKKEANAKHAFNMLVQDLTAQIAHNNDAVSRKNTEKGKQLQKEADAKGDKTDTTQTRDEDKKYLSELTATCSQKASDFEQRQQLRADELKALEQATEILSGDSVSGAGEAHLPGLLQKKASFMQLFSAGASNERVSAAISYLQAQGNKFGSRILMQVASKAGQDPFAKVKKLINDLIVRLQEEANEEAEHKGWCDTELATNEATRKEKTSKVESLHAEIDQLTSSIAKLGEQITELTQQVSDLDKAMAEATQLRNEEKTKNEATIKDAKEAQTAVAQALTVLQEFYAKASQATALLQQPEIFDSSYTGMGAESGGVIGMIEVIQSDFARLEAETTAAESQASSEYESFMTESKVDKASKSKDIEHKTAKKQNETQSLAEKNGDLEGTQKELDAALAYFDKLKPSCINTGVSFEERVARRQEEIESLQEALKILNGEDLA